MRFISKYGRLIVQIRNEISVPYASGLVHIDQESLSVQFEPQGLRPHEREAAIHYFQFNGAPQELDEATTVQPDYRIGLYDSSRASEVDRPLIEKKLTEAAESSSHIMIAPATSVPPPWPRYDDFGGSVASLLRKLEEEGHDLEDALTYERESQARPKVIEALEIAIDGGVTEEEEVVVG